MSTWRARFVDLTNQQVKAMQDEDFEGLLDAGDEIAATLRLHQAAGKPAIREEMAAASSPGPLGDSELEKNAAVGTAPGT